MNILVVNGPNLNLLGIREPKIYGVDTLSDIENWINNELRVRNITLQWYQSNHEGKIIDRLHRAMHDKNDGIIINPGAYTHYSYAIRDAIAIFNTETPENIIKGLNPDVLIKGGDCNQANIVGSQFVIENGGSVEVIDLLPGFSTTKIINERMK